LHLCHFHWQRQRFNACAFALLFTMMQLKKYLYPKVPKLSLGQYLLKRYILSINMYILGVNMYISGANMSILGPNMYILGGNLYILGTNMNI